MLNIIDPAHQECADIPFQVREQEIRNVSNAKKFFTEKNKSIWNVGKTMNRFAIYTKLVSRR